MTENRRPANRNARPQASRPGQRRPETPARAAATRPQRPAQGRSANAPRNANSAPTSKGGLIIPSCVWTTLLVCVLVLVAGFATQVLFPHAFEIDLGMNPDAEKVAEIYSNGPLRINELMSSNGGCITDENGLTRDWIEIANISDRTVSLAGYTLAKKEKAPNVFEFPNVNLGAGEFVIVFADNTLKNEAGGEYHAPFRLSSRGGSLMLFAPSGNAIDSVNYPALPQNAVYARESRRKWVATQVVTPGLPNTIENDYAAVLSREESGVEITEIVAKNLQYAPDEEGRYWDYIELHNASDEVKDLSDWHLSDDIDRPMRWSFPRGFVLQPGEYRIVYASGLGVNTEQSVHTNFGLNTEGEIVTLTSSHGTQIDQVMYDLLGEDKAWSKQADGSWSVTMPTPNAANE